MTGRSKLIAHLFRTGWAAAIMLLMFLLPTAAQARALAQDEKPVTPAETATVQSVPAFRKATNVAVITIKGEIDSITARSVERRMSEAARGGADALVFEIDSPGGEVDSVLRICNMIKQSPVPNTVAWINSDAYSGGALIALACREMVATDTASFGDAKPISGGPLALLPRGIPRDLLKKVMPPLVSEVVDSQRRYNQRVGAYVRDEYLAQAIVADDVELWEIRHKVTGVRMCIDQDEFALLFPGETMGGTTRLAGVPGLRPTRNGSNEAAKPQEAQDARPTSSEAPSGLSQPSSPAGSSRLAPIAADVEQRQTLASARPRLTASDVGSWELVEKVLDGSAPAMFKSADLLHFGWVENGSKLEGGVAQIVPIRTDDELKAFLGATNLRRLNQNTSERLVVFATTLPVRFILVVVFLIAVFVELTHPGALLPGAIAVLALVALIAPPMLLGLASWWEVVAILMGIVLLVVEVLVLPGFGIPGVLGIILLMVGLIGTFVPSGGGLFPGSGNGDRDVLTGAVTVLLAGATAMVGIWFIAKHFGRLPVLNRLVLQTPGSDDGDASVLGPEELLGEGIVKVGDSGVAITPLRPAGRIQVGDTVVDAVAEFGFVESGTRVRVSSATAMRIGVEPISGSGDSAHG